MGVEGHLEHRRDAPSRGTPRPRFPAFPVCPAWFIEVHVCVHDAGKDDEITCIDHFVAIADLAADGADDSIRDGDVGGPLAGREDDAAASNEEIGKRTHTSSIVMSCAPPQSVSLPISGNCS